MFEASNSSPIVRIEPCCVTSVRRVAAMLDLQADSFREGDALPNGWHFFILGADTRRSELTLLRLRMKNVAPLFCGCPITLTADCLEHQWCLKTH
jgi:hypothetical protein